MLLKKLLEELKLVQCPKCGEIVKLGEIIWENYERREPFQCFDCYNFEVQCYFA